MDQNNNTPKQVPENPRFKRMQEEVQQMYDIFKKEVDIDTVMNESEFEKYKPLYQKSTMPEGRPMTFDEVANLAELSQEYYHRINLNVRYTSLTTIPAKRNSYFLRFTTGFVLLLASRLVLWIFTAMFILRCRMHPDQSLKLKRIQ